MKKKIFGFIGVILLTWAAFAEPAVPAKNYTWPSTHTSIRIGGATIYCDWRDGRPFAPRQELCKYLHITESGPDPADVIEALCEKGWNLRTGRDGMVEALNPNSAASTVRPLVIRETAESKRALERFNKLLTQEHLEWLKAEPRANMVNEIGQMIARAARRPIPWTFAVVRSAEPNAACSGEGMIYITTGLLDLLNRDEIAGVLAHEVAHGARQHLEENRNETGKRAATLLDAKQVRATYEAARAAAERQISTQSRQDALESARRTYERAMEDILLRAKQHQAYQEFKPKTDERQADVIGIKYAVEAGFSADGILHALEKLQAANFHKYGTISLLGGTTHPPIGERIKALRDILLRK